MSIPGWPRCPQRVRPLNWGCPTSTCETSSGPPKRQSYVSITLQALSWESLPSGMGDDCEQAQVQWHMDPQKCDEGTNLVGARHEFVGALKEMDTPTSSHMAGVWKRQIHTRSVLMSILDQSARQLECFLLRNFLYEVMAVVNSRPLTTDQLNDSSSAEPQTTSWPWNPGLSPHLPGSLSMKIFTSARCGAEFNS